MRFYNWIAIVAATLIGISPSLAQQQQTPPANPLDTVPDKMPFNVPYGAPITAARAQAVIQAAEQEASRRGWPMNIAVADSGGNLVSFLRMDGAQVSRALEELAAIIARLQFVAAELQRAEQLESKRLRKQAPPDEGK